MEIIYWFLFFAFMITISFFTWSQLFMFFIGTTMILGGYFNYDEYSVSENWFCNGITFLIDIIKLICIVIAHTWKNFTSKTTIGLYINRFLIYLENNYQKNKVELRKRIFKSVVSTMTVSPPVRGTPRISYDSDETEDD